MEQSKVFLSFLLSSLTIGLSSCGGGSKSNKVKASSLNFDHDFTLKVPVVAYYEAYTTFEFQKGYSMEDVTGYLDQEKIPYEWKWDMLFMTPVIDDKLELFCIRGDSTVTGTDRTLYHFTSVSEDFTDNGIPNDRVLVPYFLLNSKDDFRKACAFLSFGNTGELKLNATGDYSYAKMIYSLTAQKGISYDDEEKKFTFFDKLQFRFDGDSITFSYLPVK